MDCTQLEFVKTMYIIKLILNIIRIAIPIILVLLITIDFVKATISSGEEINKIFPKSIKRLIMGTIVFFVPTIVNLVFNLASNSNGTSMFCFEEANKNNVESLEYARNQEIVEGTKKYLEYKKTLELEAEMKFKEEEKLREEARKIAEERKRKEEEERKKQQEQNNNNSNTPTNSYVVGGKNVLLIAGHNAGGNSGASATFNGKTYYEEVYTREVALNVEKKLNGIANVTSFNRDLAGDTMDLNCRNTGTCNYHTAYELMVGGQTYDFTKYDYVLEIHFNAANHAAKGTEVLIPQGNNTSIPNSILNNFTSLGFINRGIKIRNDLKVIKTVAKQGVAVSLVEVCFLDNSVDMTNYLNNKDAVASAIANAIASNLG